MNDIPETLPATEQADIGPQRARPATFAQIMAQRNQADLPATAGERGDGIESRLRFIEEGANDATVAARFRECLPNIRKELAGR